jgi:hypothetical protein
MFVSDLRQVSGFLQVLRFPPSIKLTATIYNWNIVESYEKHHNPNPQYNNSCLSLEQYTKDGYEG